MNILHMTGLLKILDPTSVNSIIIDDDLKLSPLGSGSLKKEYRFNSGYLLYIILKINDGGTGLGKYVEFYAQRFKGEQPISKPEISGMPIEMKSWRAWRERGVNPGLVEYDETAGIYVIEANFSEGQAQIENPYKIIIQYPKKEDIIAYGDTTTLANWGATISVGVKIAVKEIDYEKVIHLINEFFINTVKGGVKKAFEEIEYPPTILTP